MKKKLLAVLLSIAVIGGVTGCSGGNGKESDSKSDSTAKIVQDDLDTVKAAVDKLKSYDGDYIIQTVVDAPDGDSNYIEVCLKDGDSYTEYPQSSTSSDDSEKSDKDDKSSGVKYHMGDWISEADKVMYLVGFDKEGKTVFYTMPKTYMEKSAPRRTFYMDEILSSLTELKYYKDLTTDVGNGEEDFKFYSGTLSSSKVREILGVGSEGLYLSLKKDNPDNKNLKRFCDLYLSEMDRTLTFSDAKVIIGVADGCVKYTSMEIGGLGTKMYVTKSMITEGVTAREKPDFGKTEDYVETIQETADYAASFDTDEEALQALYESRNGASASAEPSVSPEKTEEKETKK